MSKRLQLRGGTTTEHATFTGAVREVTVDTTKDTLVVHDGATAGGFPLPTTAAEIVALISNDAIDSQHYAAGSIDTEHLAADSVTTAKIADSVVLGGSPTTTTQTAADNSTKIATTAYTDVAIAALADSAPATLNTLNELAAALGDDANYATTTATAIGLKAPLASPTFTGTVAMPADSIAEATLHVSNAGTNGQYLQKQSGNAGGLTWGTVDTTIADRAITGLKIAHDLRTGGTTHDNYWGNTHDYIFCDADVGLRFYTANSEDMRLTDAGDLHVDGNITAYSTTVSDERLKTDITTLDNAIEKIKQIRGVEFTRTKDGKRSAGVIAQELEVVLPQAISESALPYEADTETLYKTVDYDAIHAILIEAIKAQQVQIDELKAAVGGS
jgi:hypothetical protein